MAMFDARVARKLGWTLAAVAFVAIGVALIAPGAEAQYPNINIGNAASPLQSIWIGQDLACQVDYYNQPSANQFYPPGTQGPADCGTFLVAGNQLYAPCYTAQPGCTGSHGGATGGIGSFMAYQFQSQVAYGVGTITSPNCVRTYVTMPSANLDITQIDCYIFGDEHYRTDIAIHNSGTTQSPNLILYRAGDCYYGGSDFSYGWYDAATGSIACSQFANNSPPGRVIQLRPWTGGSSYREAGYGTIWANIGSHTMFTNTCMCTSNIDSGVGLSWQFTLPPGGNETYSQTTAFMPYTPPPMPTCSPAAVTVQAGIPQTFTAGSGSGIYSWTATGPNNNPSQGPPSGTYIVTWSAAGSYVVTVTDSNGNTATCTVNVTPPPPPSAAFAAAVPIGCGEWVVQFTDTSAQGFFPIVTWTWSFGDGGSSSVQSPTHTYTAEGTYTIMLDITDGWGYASSFLMTITLENQNCPVPANVPQEDGESSGRPRDGQDEAMAGVDTDGDGALDGDDNCPFEPNASQGDVDRDLLGDACDDDADGDTVRNALDNCRLARNAMQEDLDGDNAGDACDDDVDGDSLPDATDNCPLLANLDQRDVNRDDVGDACQDLADLSGAIETDAKGRPLGRSANAVDAATAEAASPTWAWAGLAAAGLLGAFVVVLAVMRRRRAE